MHRLVIHAGSIASRLVALIGLGTPANAQAEIFDNGTSGRWAAEQAMGTASHLPPDPARIQAAKDAGKVTIQVLDPGKRAQVNFHDYQKPGDNLAVVINLANNVTAGVGVSSYLDSATDVVTMDAKMGQLNDGTKHGLAR